jgi:tRNA modification GTPase
VAHQPYHRGRSEGESQALSAGDSIAAIATPAGRGGIGVVRVSGSGVRAIGAALLGELPPARMATLRDFRASRGELIDQGLAVFFPAPHSYTGEDVLEL